MPDLIDQTKTNIDPDDETNLNCGRDMRVVTDGEMLADGIVELADKDEYIDEP
jgi:hypothetical protein